MKGSIELDKLQVAYGEEEVIKGISMTFAPGKVTAIIGPSGCGKSTLLRCLNRLSDVTDGCRVYGRATLDGEDIARLDPILLRRRVGMVFQRPNPFPMSIKENVLYGLKAQGAGKRNARSITEDSLTRAALWDEVRDRLHSSALNLSLGQQQRLCIARCLAVSPEVVLMDEPAASLDPISTVKLEESIVAMKGEYTVLLVTHDVQEARRVADYTVFLYQGRVVEFGETEALFANPQQEATRAFIEGRLLLEVAEPVAQK